MPGKYGNPMVNSETLFASQPHVVDFSNTEIAFAHKSDKELKRTSWLFQMMSKPWLVRAGESVGLWLNSSHIHIFNPLIRATIFKQFCGGISLEDSKDAIDHLRQQGTMTVLDYGAEGKAKEDDFDQALQENLRAIKFAAGYPGVPVVSSKVTALASNGVLERVQTGKPLSREDQEAFERIKGRLDTLCHAAWSNGVAVFIDAEETWMQDTIDRLVKMMMERYNKERVVVYHTYQMYRMDKLKSLKADHQEAQQKGYLLGAKMVRGAYMEKERARASDQGYPSPIHETIEATHRDFNAAIAYCVHHYEQIASCNASHNLESNLLQAEMIVARGLPKGHAHLNFCQLMGMSDYITFNLARAGFNVAKYVPYGPVKEVVPYLIRRARENTAVTGEMSRELHLITAEMKRREMK
jgi:proline dehydrogenase